MKAPNSCSLSRRSTKKYFFDAVADFDDIVESKNQWESKFVGPLSKTIQSTTSFYGEKSECSHQKLSPSQLTLQSKNSNELSDLSSFKKVNVFKRASNSDFRRPFTFSTWERSQELNRVPYEKSQVYLTKERSPNQGYYFVREKKPCGYSSENTVRGLDIRDTSTIKITENSGGTQGERNKISVNEFFFF